MTVTAHIDALYDKHANLELAIETERARPMPDFVAITALKKRKLLLKEEIASLTPLMRRRSSSG